MAIIIRISMGKIRLEMPNRMNLSLVMLRSSTYLLIPITLSLAVMRYRNYLLSSK